MAYWFIRRTASDTDSRETYNATGGRMIMRRSHNQTETQVYFILRDESEDASAIHRKLIIQQQQFWAEKCRNAGWQNDRFIKGLMVTDSFYSQEVVQVRTDTWSQGRVVLVGDAAYCPSPFSSMGVSSSLVVAYVLAREINRNSDHLPFASARYDSSLRPFVAEMQNLKPFLLRLGMPNTKWGIKAPHAVAALTCFLRLPDLIARHSRKDTRAGLLQKRRGQAASNPLAVSN